MSGLRGVSAAAREIPCSENWLRELDRRGVVPAVRDSAGRRLWDDKAIDKAKAHLSRSRRGSRAA